jgi:hypothetical protein
MLATKENAREFGKPGCRPRGRLRTLKWSVREFAGMILTDPVVQQRILKQARAGTLPPRVLVELLHYYGGPPPSKPELPPPDPTLAAEEAERRARFLRLSKDERQQLATLLGRLNAPAPAGPGGGPAQPGHEAR